MASAYPISTSKESIAVVKVLLTEPPVEAFHWMKPTWNCPDVA